MSILRSLGRGVHQGGPDSGAKYGKIIARMHRKKEKVWSKNRGIPLSSSTLGDLGKH